MARLNPNLNYKVARASDGVRRFDRPDGSLPVGDVGGTPGAGVTALSISAPNGLADGNTLIVTPNVGGGFGTGPTKQATLGFGQGWMYENAIGTGMSDHVDPLSGEAWHSETQNNPHRVIREKDGIRALYTSNEGGDLGATLGGKLLGWDSGGDMPANELIFISRVSHGTADFVNAPGQDGYAWAQIDSVDSDTQVTLTAPFAGDTRSNTGNLNGVISASMYDDAGKYRFAGTFTQGGLVVTSPTAKFLTNAKPGDYIGSTAVEAQWKELRISSIFSLGERDAQNMVPNFYIKQNPRVKGDAASSRVVEMAEPDVNNNAIIKPGLYGPGQMMADKWYRLDTRINLGPIGIDGGSVHSRRICHADGDGITDVRWANSSGRNLCRMHTDKYRMRWVMLQDFLTYSYNGRIHQTDVLVQTGSYARFEIANSVHPSTTTEAYILPFKQWANGQVELHLWKCLFPDYSSKFIHYYNDDGEFVAGVALNG